METAVVLFTRDLRVHDNPALAGACARAATVVPLFVADPALTVPPNRAKFLADSVAALREELRGLGGDLVIREGDPVAETIRLAVETGAGAVFTAADVSRYAARRQRELARDCEQHRIALEVTPGHQVVPATDVRPGAGGDHYRVFTPYWRAWSAARWRPACPVPDKVILPADVKPGDLPSCGQGYSAGLAPGGEPAGRERAAAWLHGPLHGYPDAHDDLAADETSRLSAYLRFGCVSALALARDALARPGGEEFCRQLAWRDFFHQVTLAFPDLAKRDYRAPADGAGWADNQTALDAWRAGQTGIPVVDAGLRQLVAEGFMHNRARMITASFLTRNLGLDWRHGYRHFGDLLADADVANNAGNWQWVAGTGNNTRPNRVMNPLRQAERFDPGGDYVRRYVPELESLAGKQVHTPWTLPAAQRRQLTYPDPVVELK